MSKKTKAAKQKAAARKSTKPLRNISRILTDTTNGWQVRVFRDGEMHTKFFSATSVGVNKAMNQAKKYRNEYLKTAPPPKPGAAQMGFKSRRNRSGVPGVHRTKHVTSRGEKVDAWVAAWVEPDGRRMKRSFSVSVHGAKKAKELAVARRRQAEMEISGKSER